MNPTKIILGEKSQKPKSTSFMISLYKVQNQAKLSYGDRSGDGAYFVG